MAKREKAEKQRSQEVKRQEQQEGAEVGAQQAAAAAAAAARGAKAADATQMKRRAELEAMAARQRAEHSSGNGRSGSGGGGSSSSASGNQRRAKDPTQGLAQGFFGSAPPSHTSEEQRAPSRPSSSPAAAVAAADGGDSSVQELAAVRSATRTAHLESASPAGLTDSCPICMYVRVEVLMADSVGVQAAAALMPSAQHPLQVARSRFGALWKSMPADERRDALQAAMAEAAAAV